MKPDIMQPDTPIVDYKDIVVGMGVRDSEGYPGTVLDKEDIHNVSVIYNNGVSDTHCLVEDCTTCPYNPLYYY